MSLQDRHTGKDRANDDRVTDYRAIDFRAVCRAIPLSLVLDLLEFHPTRSRGSNLRGCCVLCSSAEPERRTSRTQTCFAADLSRDVWHCFGCHRGGDQLTLWSQATHKPFYTGTILLCQTTGLPIPWIEPETPFPNPSSASH